MTKYIKTHMILCFLILSFLITQAVFAAGLPGLSPEDAKKIMPVSQLKRGMRGYGLTVFQGTKIEKFDVEILGILKQANTGKDLILLRAGGGPINKRNTGIIAGMSGSPIYINGKIVGAISYGSGFSKEPIGMATPIADMLEAWDENLPKEASGYSSTSKLSTPVSIGGVTVKSVSIDCPGSEYVGIRDGVLHMQPLMTPLMVSGMSQRGINKLAEILRPYNIMPVAGPGSSGAKSRALKATLEPGAALGVALATGDIDLTGIGTLTYRNGNKIVGFGHPMMGIGAIDAPMTTAYIEDVISSYRVSTKIGTPIETLGRINQDRPWSVAGLVGKMPNMIPVRVSVIDKATKRSKTFKIQTVNHPLIAGQLTMVLIGESIYQVRPAPGDATAVVTYEINADKVGKIRRSNVFFDNVAIDGAAIMDVGSLLMLLSTNRFYPLDIKSVDVKVEITDKRNTATIDRIFVKESEFEPGETVDVGVVLRPYKKDRITKTYKIKIPATAPNGKLVLLVRGGASSNLMGAMGASPDESAETMSESGLNYSSDLANADNINQLIEKFLEREKNNEIVLQLFMRNTAVNVAGEKLSGLPDPIADVMKSSRNSGLRMEREEVKERYTEDMIISGMARLVIEVKRKDLKEKKSTPKSSTSEPEASSPDITPPSSDEYEASSYDMYDASHLALLKMTESSSVDNTDNREASSEDESSEAIEEEPSDSESSESDSKSEESKPEESKTNTDKKSTTKTKVKTVVRQVKTWTQNKQADFAKGKFYGVSANSNNKLELVPTLNKLVETPEQFVWSLACAKDGVYAGTGSSGKIYHISESGDIKQFYATGELQVHSLACDQRGNLYAGTSPNGKIYKIAPDGKGTLIFDAPEKYILALAVDSQDNVYAGTGDAGKIYKIAPDGKTKLYCNINEQQILSLHWSPKTGLVVGTGINGVVYQINSYGVPIPIFNASEGSVTSLTSDSEGNIYAGTSTKGAIYKISSDGRSKTLMPKATRVLSMTSDEKGNIYAVSDSLLVRIAPDETVTNIDSIQDKVQFLALALNNDNKTIFAGTGNIGAVYISKCCNLSGTFESAVHDTNMISRWGRIRWHADTPEGTSVTLQTRTGNVAEPDDTWSDWSEPYTNCNGTKINSKNARYIQYKVTLKSNNSEVTPKLSSVSLTYLTPNQYPTVKLVSPVGGEVLSGKTTIKWTGSDPDKDILTYDVYYSKDGKNWQTLVGGITGTPSSSKSEKEIRDKVKAEVEKSPDIPDKIKEKAIKNIEGNKKSDSTSNANAGVGQSITKTSHDWDTSKVEDGKYIIKIVASDKTSNADDALTKEAISDTFIICNTAPELSVYKSGKEIKVSGAATIQGSARSKLIDIAGVQYKIDSGDWMAARPLDGIFDSPDETFEIKTDNLSPGQHKIEIQAIDIAGNAKSEVITVKAE